jgi:hypothetical protein
MENTSNILGCSIVLVLGIASFLWLRKSRRSPPKSGVQDDPSPVDSHPKKLVLPESHLKKHDLHRIDAYKDFYSATKQQRDAQAASGPADGLVLPTPFTLSDLFRVPSVQECFLERLRERGYATLKVRL